jgi:glycosyltransferase involved in cell wall biosynthesis
MEIQDMRTLSIALTHYNRFDLLVECIAPVLDDPRIAQFVISDDASTDGSWEKLVAKYDTHHKVYLHRNDRNLDCYANKHMAVSLAKTDWVILFDSDNLLTKEYLDVLWELEWFSDTLYCPTFAKPHFDYRKFSGINISRHNVHPWVDQPHFTTALNTANYLVPRAGYLKAFDPTVNPHTADSIFMAYRWLSINGLLFFVPGLEYFHRVHGGSHYKKNVHKTGSFARDVEQKLKALR